MNQLIISNNKVLRSVDTPLYRGYAQANDITILASDNVKFEWKGAKIPWKVWTDIVCFLRWTQEQFKEEAMVTLFYHQANRTWAAWAFPQEPNGMTIRLLPNEPVYKEDRARFGEGWIQAGSIHHHCTTSAFQSSTDTTDEQDRDGVHITLGKMTDAVLDTHVRQIFDGIQGKTELIDWIETPPWLKDAPEYLRTDFTAFAIKAVRNEGFPKEWEDRIYKREVPPPFIYGTHMHPPATGPIPQQQTLMLRQPSKTSTEGGKRGRRQSKRQEEMAAHLATLPESEWQLKSKMVIQDICTMQQITELEAYSLLTAFPNQLSVEDHAQRRELIQSFARAAIPQLYAEKLLEDMVMGIAVIP